MLHPQPAPTTPTNVAPTATSPALDAAQLKQTFDQEGCVVLPGLVSKAELRSVQTHLSEEFERWKRSSAAFRGGGILSGHLNCSPGIIAKGVLAELKAAGVLELVQSLH